MIAAACTGTQDEPSDDAAGSPTATRGSTTPIPGVVEVPTDAGRLAVLDGVGNLVTLAPDGSDPVLLAEAVQGQTLVRQPAWSPDGSRLAWVRLDAGDGSVEASVVTMTVGGTRPTEAAIGVAPFYLAWDPTSSRIAYLGSSSPTEIEIGVVDISAGGDESVPLDAGSPLYLSWDPSGEQLLVHIGTDRLDRLRLDGGLSTVHPQPGTFNAPVWTADGRSVVYASMTANEQRLVSHTLQQDRGRDLVRFDGGIRFIVSPDGTRVAFQVLGDAGQPEPLSIVDRATGTIEVVTEEITPAFFWSPEGDRLLYLLPERQPDRVWLRWGIWDGATSFLGPRFLPTQVFAREYLQFFDQFAQSMTLWAPDGTAFTYAGIGESGDQGIWVQSARPGTEPVLVADGVFASWSPA